MQILRTKSNTQKNLTTLYFNKVKYGIEPINKFINFIMSASVENRNQKINLFQQKGYEDEHQSQAQLDFSNRIISDRDAMQITCKKSRLITMILVLILVQVMVVWYFSRVNCKQPLPSNINQVQASNQIQNAQSNPTQSSNSKNTRTSNNDKKQSSSTKPPQKTYQTQIINTKLPQNPGKNQPQQIARRPEAFDQLKQNFGQLSHLPTSRHFHQPIKHSYPTVGVPIPFNQFNFTQVKKKDLKEFDQSLLSLLKPYNDTNCVFSRYGQQNDGGYIICENFIKHSEALVNLGIQGSDQFGCDLTSAHQMPNYQFDCTNSKRPICQTNFKNNFFQDACLGEFTEKKDFQFWTLQDLIKRKNLTNKHIMLKIDIEGSEYLGLRYFPLEYLDYIDQIFMEAHFGVFAPQQWGFLDVFRSITDKFVSVNYHINNFGCFPQTRPLLSQAIQITFVNKNIIKLYSQDRSWTKHPLNTPNNPNKTECQPSD